MGHKSYRCGLVCRKNPVEVFLKGASTKAKRWDVLQLMGLGGSKDHHAPLNVRRHFWLKSLGSRAEYFEMQHVRQRNPRYTCCICQKPPPRGRWQYWHTASAEGLCVRRPLYIDSHGNQCFVKCWRCEFICRLLAFIQEELADMMSEAEDSTDSDDV